MVVTILIELQIGSAFYKQRIGIPQGSVLSTLLCNVLYGDLEASQKFKFTEDVSNVSKTTYRYSPLMTVHSSCSAMWMTISLLQQSWKSLNSFWT